MEYYSAIERNETGSFVETRIDLENVIQNEISQKEKTIYCTLMHICGIQKSGIDDLICKAEIETQMQRTNLWTPRGKEDGRNWETEVDTYTIEIMHKMDN